MWARVLKLSASPRKLLRSVLALDDSPHAIALGVAIGMFFGMTPTVGIQTLFILAFLAITRRFFYFNTAAAMAATYVSNPITMVPLYYFWYRLGALFVGGQATMEQVESVLEFDGLAGWWESVCTIGAEVGIPILVGAAITAPICAALSYPACYSMIVWVRSGSDQGPPSSKTGTRLAIDAALASVDDHADEPPVVENDNSESRCMAV